MSTIVETLQIVEARYVGDYKIQFTFSDGTMNEVDFHAFLSQPYQNPMVSQYLDQDRFKQFEIIRNRDISWDDDYEMCFSLETLYTGKF